MIIILLNLEVSGIILDMLSNFKCIRGKSVTCHKAAKEEEVLAMIRQEPHQIYLVFYQAVDVHSLGRLYSLAREKLLRLHLVAICSDFQQGIESINAGDTYALKLPLRKEQLCLCMQKVAENIS